MMCRKVLLQAVLLPGLFFLSNALSAAPVRDGGIDPANLGKGVWIYSMTDATNHLGGHAAGVTNVNSLMQFYRGAGLRYCLIKAATSDKLFNACYATPQFTSNLVNIAHTNGIEVFGYNRSYGSNIVGEVAIADYVFNQGADGFVFDAEAEWESGSAWITNGSAQAWQLCSMVRSNWPNKFLAHAPFAIIYLHSTFPYKEFGFWCDAVMPQIYHFSSAGLKGSPSATVNWSDVNWAAWQKSLASLPVTNFNGVAVNWTNAIKPITPLEDVYGEVVSGGIICEGAAGAVYPDGDVQQFIDYSAADPNAPTAGGYRGINFWRADTIGTNQWAHIAAGNSGNYSNLVNTIVLDDSQATYVGGWNSVKVFAATTTTPAYYGATGLDTNCFGTNYCYKGQAAALAYAQFNPVIVIGGQYDLFQWHPYLTNASFATPFMIGTPAGTNTVSVNQQTNAGNWSLAGRFALPAGTNNFIRVMNNFTDTSNVAVVDGLKLVYADKDVILDNTNPEVSYAGTWTVSSASAGHYLDDYRYAGTAADATDVATYRPNLPNPGLYDISIWFPQDTNRATNAPWTVSFFGGSTNILVNQQTNGGGWFPIAAARPFQAGTNGSVQVANNAGNSVVIADGVRFSFAGPLAPLALQSVARRADGRIQFTVSSTPGYNVWLERSTNLPAWSPLTNFVNTSGTFIYTDDSATNYSAGFYRLHQ